MSGYRKQLQPVLAALCIALASSGCLSIGNASADPTLADEIEELDELRRAGKLSDQQFHVGVNTLLRTPR